MTNTTLTRISGDEIKTNHFTYKPPKGMAIIYLYKCRIPETNEVFYYVGSTAQSIFERAGKDYNNYRMGLDAHTKFSEYLAKYGYAFITPIILYVVSEAERAQVEQEMINEYNAISLGFNTIRAVRLDATPVLTFADKQSNGYKKNNPLPCGDEDYALTIRHKDGTEEIATINKGAYERYYNGQALCFDRPGRKGQLCKQVRSISTKSGRTNKTMLSYIADDLGIRLCFGPAGPHVLTLDNIYVGSKNDRKTLRIFLKENPEYIAKVFYLTFGIWDTDDEAQATA